MGSHHQLETAAGTIAWYPIESAADSAAIGRLPYVKRVLLENVVRNAALGKASEDETAAVIDPGGLAPREFGFRPARVVLQDLTGVPLVASLAAMRSAVAARGGDVSKVNPLFPVDLVIDHSVIVDEFGSPDALSRNVALEMERNRERYEFLRWAQQSFSNFRVVPPGGGIVHQVNLEYLASVVVTRNEGGVTVAAPDTVVGTDSHTTMISGAGILGWGVGGIEAEAAMLGEPISMLTPTVVGVHLEGELPEGTTATDLVLALTQVLRNHGVVGKFVEYFGPGIEALALTDRATVANMAPEYGATTGFFPVDEQTLAYLRATGRPADLVDLVERYTKANRLFHEAEAPEYDELVSFDLSTVEPSLAGPSRPQDRLGLGEVKDAYRKALAATRESAALGGGDGSADARKAEIVIAGEKVSVGDGSVVIAAITSCTNTSNPAVLIGAGLLARKAVEAGLSVSPVVKTSFAPGSQVVMDYLATAGLVEPLEKLGFYLTGFGCTVCIGNSGPLPDPVADAIVEMDLACSAVLSGNRNFEGRVHPQVRYAFLASPPLVVAYAIAGTTDIDLTSEPLGTNGDGEPVYLRDIWPSQREVTDLVNSALDPEQFSERYGQVFDGDDAWNSLAVPKGPVFEFDPSSTYLAEPPFVAELEGQPAEPGDIVGARVLLKLGDTITTDHISPASAIPESSPAGRWLIERGVTTDKLHSYGARRGNHEVMVRGTFANIRIRNQLVPGVEGGFTVHLPGGETTTVFEASEKYRGEGTPLIVLAGSDYGAGSSRDWAAKGTRLLGIKAVIAKSFERIHRSNLVQMGLLPLEYLPGEDAETLGLTGTELFSIRGISGALEPRARLHVTATRDDGSEIEFGVTARIDSETDLCYYRHGGILPMVLRNLAS